MYIYIYIYIYIPLLTLTAVRSLALYSCFAWMVHRCSLPLLASMSSDLSFLILSIRLSSVRSPPTDRAPMVVCVFVHIYIFFYLFFKIKIQNTFVWKASNRFNSRFEFPAFVYVDVVFSKVQTTKHRTYRCVELSDYRTVENSERSRVLAFSSSC